ncbi:MAG: AraC family transcriptional regulator, partial [Gemmatimonadetes bacterium]|nr:AraC family transcriptional regulator [Gemmatimonadota bacterium]
MSSVTSIFARRMVQAAGDSVDGAALLRSIGLDPNSPLDVTQMVTADAYYDLLERIAEDMIDA